MKRPIALALVPFLVMACSSRPSQDSDANLQTEWTDVVDVKEQARGVSSERRDYIRELDEARGSMVVAGLAGRNVSDAKTRLEMIFEIVRADSRGFFAQLRKNRPIYHSPAAVNSTVTGKEAKVPNIYIVTKHADVDEVLTQHSIFSVKPYEKIMDATVGHPYMLGRENSAANREKPAMRHSINGQQNDLVRVRAIIKHLAREAITEGTENGEIDIVKSVSRRVPLGLNDEYFGFNPPDQETMARWSRATQHAFFHNPFRDSKEGKAADAASIQAGNEMRAYINGKLLPQRRRELANGRPADDTVSRMLKASAAHAQHGLVAERLVPNVIGLLVGSVETTSAAITQSLQVIMNNESIRKAAIDAARTGNDNRLNRIVWEALRFDPVNPWVGRYVEQDYTLKSGAKILKGSLVLAATESAMWDEDYFQNPTAFRLNRDPEKYMHLGYGYHRCLGDDVSLVMVPETIKQILLMTGVERTEKSRIDQKGGPFPESYILKVKDSTGRRLFELPKSASAETILKYVDLGAFVAGKVVQMDQRKQALSAINGIINGKGVQRDRALDAFPALVANAAKNNTPAELVKACEEGNPKSVEVFPNPVDRRNYCSVRVDFRACFFAQRLLNHQSSYASYNHCSYGLKLMTPEERQSFAQDMKNHDLFYFLGLQ